jgi:thiamine pyrophosphokinase
MASSALIILAGARTIPPVDGDHIVICADSGYSEASERSIAVDHLVGDMDSIGAEYLQQARDRDVHISVHEREKDQTDGELALRLALELGCTKIVITGGKKGRFDHVVSTALLPFICDEHMEVEVWIGDEMIVLLDQGSKKEFFDRWNVVSLVPVAGSCRVATSGLKWELLSEVLEMGGTRGIHNEPVSIPYSIECIEGRVLVVLSNME